MTQEEREAMWGSLEWQQRMSAADIYAAQYPPLRLSDSVYAKILDLPEAEFDALIEIATLRLMVNG